MRWIKHLAFVALISQCLADEPMPGIRPPNNDAMAWRWDARLMNMGSSTCGVRNEFDNPEVVERRIKEMKNLGITVTQLDGLHQRNVYLDRFGMLLRNTKMICDIAHRHGLKVIEHSDVTIMPYRNQTGYGLKLLLENFDWFQRDVQFDHVINNPCINNPNFKKHYFDMITEYLAKTGVDCVKLDEIIFARGRACGCPHCRAKFKQDTGLELPDDHTDPFFDSSSGGRTFTNTNDRRLLTWFRWRMECLTQWRLDLRKAMNRVNLNVSFMVYTTHYGLTSNYSTTGTGGNIFLDARVCDWLGTEIMSRNIYHSPRGVFCFRKMFAGLGQWADTPVYGLVYHRQNPDIARMGWALNIMHRELPLMGAVEGADMSYVGWKDKMVNRYARPVADIAILFSDQSRNWERMAGYLADTGGYSECMSDAHIQHVFLMEGDLKADKLAEYRLLMMPSTSCISDAQADEIRQYVNAGGRLLISGHASLLDELGFARKDFALSDITNVKYGGGWAPKGCSLKMLDRTIPLAHPALHVQLADPAKSKIIGELIDAQNNMRGPAIVETPYGEGSVIYDACRLGIYNWEREYTVGDKYSYRRDKATQDLAVELVRRAHGHPMIFEADPSTPEKVFITTYRHRREGIEQILVHLLNATGSVIESGQIVPGTTPANPWPSLRADLCFEIELPSLKKVSIASPDFAGRRPVRITPSGNRHKVTVSKSDVHWFSTVYFDL